MLTFFGKNIWVESTGAHECYIWKNAVHAICASKCTEVDEGYGSKVTCRNCEGDEPAVKKTTTWSIKYPSKSPFKFW